jgi:hypothetical protein
MRIHAEIASLPADRDGIADDDLVTGPVWAHLQGVEMSTFNSMLTRARVHRRHDAEHPGEKPQAVPGDIPDPDEYAGRTPMWRMGTYRAWEARRPGKASNRGKSGAGSRGGRGTGRPVRLPIECPHCHREITEADVEEFEGKRRAAYAELRDSGVSAAEAAGRLEMREARARQAEFDWRRQGKAPLEVADGRKALGA